MADAPTPMIADQFRGLPMGDLIGGPLTAACDAQVKLARATADFIQVVGFSGADENGKGNTVRTVHFKFDRPVTAGGAPTGENGAQTEEVELEIPLLAIVNVPALSVKSLNVTFDMEVKSSQSTHEESDMKAEADLTAKVGFGPFSAKVHIHGSVASHKESTRSSDQSAKYHVELEARDDGMPEGLARVMDILQTSIAPKTIAPPKAA